MPASAPGFADPALSLDPACPIRLEAGAEFGELPGIERLADLAHEVQVVVQVVDRGEHRAQHPAAAIEVVQVGAAEAIAPALVPRHAGGARTGVAAAARIDRLRIALVAGVAHLEIAVAREQ